MKYRYLPAAIMLSAGAITMFICLYNRYETLYSLEVLLAVLIIFLIIGSLTRKALIKIIAMGKYGEKEADTETNDDTNEDTGSIENTEDNENKDNDISDSQVN